MTALRTIAVLAIALLAMPAWSQVENEDYQVLSPAQKPTTPGKIEVIEFFSYACPHCYRMQPLISEWAKALPANAVLVKVPVSFGRRDWGMLSRAYYALEATGDLQRLDDALFDAIHKEQRPMFDEDHLATWAAEHGVDAERFRAEFNSFAVTTKASHAEQMSRSYQVSGVPHLTVDGKYSVLGNTYQDMLKNARKLIDKAAAQGGGSGSGARN
jgi:thiol:disulfide interchange protein DsbA